MNDNKALWEQGEGRPLPLPQAVGLMGLAAVINSGSGLLVRFLEAASDWQAVFWRGLSLGLMVGLILALRHGKSTPGLVWRIGWTGVAGALFFAGALSFFVLALAHTSVANTVFTMSAIPFFTAILAWLLLGEEIDGVTGLAIIVAMSGIAIMVTGGLGNGSLSGNLMALVAALCFSGFVVALRYGAAFDMLPVIMVGAFLAVLFALLMNAQVMAVSKRDLLLCLLWGGVLSSSAHFFMIRASRSLSGAHLSLLVLLEFVLAPLWVFVFVNEIPDRLTLFGGGIVLAAIGAHAIFSLACRTPDQQEQ